MQLHHLKDRRTQRASAYLTVFYQLTLGLILLIGLAGCQNPAPDNDLPTATPTRKPGSTPLPLSTGLPTLEESPSSDLPPTATPPPQLSKLGLQDSDLHRVAIQFWHPWGGEEGALLGEIIEEFNLANPWKIQVETRAFEGFGRLEEAVAASARDRLFPDVLVGYNYQAAGWDAGDTMLADLDDYTDDAKWGLTDEEKADFYPIFWSQDVISVTSQTGSGSESKRMGIPFHRLGLVIFYNQSWAEELGYSTPPDTPFNFRLQACAAAEDSNRDTNPDNNNSGLIVTANPSAMLGWIYAYGGDVIQPEGKGYQFATPEAERALDFLKGLQDYHCTWSFNGVDAAAEFAARRGLFYIDTPASLPALRAAFKAAGNEDTWTVIPFPSAADGAVMNAFGPSLLMPRSTSEEQLAAWLLIKWLVDPQNQARWVQGGYFLPTRASSLEYLDSALGSDPLYEQAIELLPYSRSEPAYASWSEVRWALLDLQKELLSADFDAEEMPDLLENLDQIALEIHTQMQ